VFCVLGVDYVFWFQKKISAAFLCSKLFDKKVKSVNFLGIQMCLFSLCCLAPVRNLMRFQSILRGFCSMVKAKTNADRPELTTKTY
jgi:hypothetical protein